MRKNFTLFLWSILLFLTGTGAARATDYYAFSVAGTSITSDNAFSFASSNSAITGTAIYVSAKNRLILYGTTIDLTNSSSVTNAIENYNDDNLEIYISGNVTIKAPQGDAFYLRKNTKFNFDTGATLTIIASKGVETDINTYASSSKALTVTLGGADISNTAGIGIYNNSGTQLSLSLSGTNKLSASDVGILSLDGTRLSGGQLNLTSGATGIISNGDLSISNDTLTVKSAAAALTSNSSSALTISKSIVHTTVSSGHNIDGFASATLTGCSFEGGNTYDTTNKVLTDANGKAVSGTADIGILVTYDLKVKGIAVTSNNAADILGDKTVSYDASSQTLTLNNAHIDAGSEQGIGLTKGQLKINLVGSNSITSTATGISATGSDITISGSDASLTIGGGTIGIYAGVPSDKFYGMLTISGTTVNASGSVYAFRGDNAMTLSIKNANVYASANRGCISGFSSVYLSDELITEPASGATFKYGTGYTDADGKLIGGKLTILAGTDYQFSVGGVEVTSINAADILGDGTASYDSESKTLTLSDAHISGSSYGVDLSNTSIRGLKLNGTSTIQTTSAGIISNTTDPLAITSSEGTGSLDISGGYTGIISKGNLILNGVTLKVSGTNFAFTTWNSSLFVATNATVIGKAASDAKIFNGFSSVILNDCQVVTPTGGDAATVTGSAVIAPTTFTLTLPASGLATLDLGFAATIPDGVTLYGVTSIDNAQSTAKLNQLDASATTLAANTPVIVKGEAGQSYTFSLSKEAGTSIEGNLLKGVLVDTDFDPSDTKTTYYILSGGQFHAADITASDHSIKANKAYLSMAVAGSKSYQLDFGSPSAVRQLPVDGQKDQKADVYYNLQGQRVLSPARGLYIRNGRKVFVK